MAASSSPTAVEVNQWIDETTERVIDKLRYNVTHYGDNPKSGTSVPSIEKQKAKLQFVGMLLEKHDEHEKANKRKKSELHRMIRGYVGEFVRQSEHQITPCNIDHNRNPKAAAYWESQGAKEFSDAIIGGVTHTATSYNHLRDRYTKSGQRSAAFHAVGEVIRVTIDVFKAEYPEFDPVHPPAPSLYNNHNAAIKLAFDLRDSASALKR